jgi:ABC-2 type transport system ATP-binding protein
VVPRPEVDDGQVLHVAGLHKAYGSEPALRGVDLDVAEGEVVALLGPNGAGKTTLVSIVAGLRTADSGVVEVAGIDALRRSKEVRRLLGIAPQDTGLYPVVSVRQNLTLFGELNGLRRREVRRRAAEVAEALALTDLLDRPAGRLSGGQKRRVHTAIAFMHRPRLLLLDEATTGADVETRAHILDLVRRLSEEGCSVLYSTHYLAEVGSMPATVTILDRGRVIARGDPDALVSQHAVPTVELTFRGEAPPLPGTDAVVDGSLLRVPSRDPGATLAQVLLQVDSARLASVEIVRPDLEAVYLALTGRRYRQEDAEAPQEARSDVGSDGVSAS